LAGARWCGKTDEGVSEKHYAFCGGEKNYKLSDPKKIRFFVNLDPISSFAVSAAILNAEV